ncbi:type II secretion system F family protein [Streptomyces sp. Je 1-79]|uniref:type II secretion system F family protein n=1 Tax=Streptomyces sp. Je 1-79 TaxID=2943847 RepID=UPI0021A47C18|nr:type II secretion system F family protein [Streptomyces sp. Je 1-79]MCT4354619.1 type II secretion system F family protein [Streptomyces sp. Je 1-79]
MTGSAGLLGEFVHRLGAVVAVTASVAWAAWTVADRRRERRTRKRIAALVATGAVDDGRRGGGFPPWLRRWAVPLAAAVVGWALIGGAAGVLVGIAGGWGVRWWSTRRVPATGDEEEAARQLPLAADLLAACASAGAGPGEAAEAVGRSLGGPVGERLARTAAELRLGGEPADVWRRFGAIPGAEGLARCLERAGSSGAPAAEAVSRHAADLRADRARKAAARAQRAQVLITAPVGLCFLPAFLAVGVAPVVIGLATGLLRS